MLKGLSTKFKELLHELNISMLDSQQYPLHLYLSNNKEDIVVFRFELSWVKFFPPLIKKNPQLGIYEKRNHANEKNIIVLFLQTKD